PGVGDGRFLQTGRVGEGSAPVLGGRPAGTKAHYLRATSSPRVSISGVDRARPATPPAVEQSGGSRRTTGAQPTGGGACGPPRLPPGDGPMAHGSLRRRHHLGTEVRGPGTPRD